MSTHYTHLCFEWRLPADAAKCFNDVIAIFDDRDISDRTDLHSDAEKLAESLIEMDSDYYPMFTVLDGPEKSTDPGFAEIVVMDDGGECHIDYLCMALEAIIKHFNLDAVAFEYAKTSSRPMTGAYGGGAIYISQSGIKVCTSGEMLEALSSAESRPSLSL